MGDSAENSLVDIEGTVKWFDPKKGFGFIIGPDQQDIFIHWSQIQGEGFRVLKDGSRVRYSASSGGKGWFATKCVRLDTFIEVTVRPTTGYARSPRR